MKIFFCRFFKWPILDGIQLFWEGDFPQHLYVSNPNGIRGVLTMSSGLYARKEVIEAHVERFVANHSGYFAPFDEDFPEELNFVIDDGFARINQQHFLRYGPGYALNLAIRGDIQDLDIEMYRKLFFQIEVDERQIPQHDSPYVNFPIDEDVRFMTLGIQRHLERQFSYE